MISRTKLIISLLALKGYGPKTVNYLIAVLPENVGNAQDLIGFLESIKGSGLPKLKVPDVKSCTNALEAAEIILSANEREDVSTLICGDRNYPQGLADIESRPPLLYIKGDVTSVKEPNNLVAVVGSRKPSDWGAERCYELARKLGNDGLHVVSGLAIGCDTAAHKGCLAAVGSGKTIAVLAGGLDQIDPSVNRDLSTEIVEKGGCLISESAIGTRPSRYSFVQRNRIQSGLCNRIIVAETAIDGGTMHTANFALKYGRQLGCLARTIEGSIIAMSEGNAQLMKEQSVRAITNPFDLEKFMSS
jgi:DNA processing protein